MLQGLKNNDIKPCKVVYLPESLGSLRIRQALFELELRFEGYVFVKTFQLNITARNKEPEFSLAA